MAITFDADGFQVIQPTNNGNTGDSRLIYIAADGDDANAAAVYSGRGYYLPSDTEIGDDPYNPSGAIVAYKTARAAMKKVRGTGWVETDSEGNEIVSITVRDQKDAPTNSPGSGYPDWVLFKRGDTFPKEEDYQSPGWALLSGDIGNILGSVCWGDNIIAGGAFRYEAGYPRGKSVEEPYVITAWGNPADPRPIIEGGFTVHGLMAFANISSLDIQATPTNRYGINYGNASTINWKAWHKIHVEDCRSQGHGMISIQGGGPTTDLTLRRCVYTDGWNAGGHNSSPFNGLNDGAKLTFEECVFDKNGYKENPDDASKWTATYVSSLSLGGADGFAEDGTGVQPTRTWFDRNWYMAGAAGDTLVLRGNLVARTGGGAEQLRSGGLLYKNTFLFCHDGVINGAPEDGYGKHDNLSVQNLHLHDDLFLPPGGYGMQNYLQGGNAVLYDNIYAHVHERTKNPFNGPGSFLLWNSIENEIYKKAIINCDIYHNNEMAGPGTQRSTVSREHPVVTLKFNKIAFNPLTTVGSTSSTIPSIFKSTQGRLASISRQYYSDLDTIDNNIYFGNPEHQNFLFTYAASPLGVASNKTFAQWQGLTYDVGSTMTADWATFKTEAGWSSPERDIISYMETIDGEYAPDSNVRVDYMCGVTQADAQLVIDVLPDTGWGSFTEDQQTLAARRFHAALTFLYRARDNRKGSWDENYTAIALNNYIRAGFGKGEVDAGYTLGLSDIENYIDTTPIQPCLVTEFSPSSIIIDEAGATGEVTISTSAENCGWVVSSNKPWLIVTSETSGTGLGTIEYTVEENTTSLDRTATLSAGGQYFTVSQAGSNCVVTSISPTSNTAAVGGETGEFDINTSSNSCSWLATTNDSWITITSGSTGEGSTGTIQYSVDENPQGYSRGGSIEVGVFSHTIIQEGRSDGTNRVSPHNHILVGSYSGHIEKPSAKSYYLDLNMSKAKTIRKVTTMTSSGTCSYDLLTATDTLITQSVSSSTIDVKTCNYLCAEASVLHIKVYNITSDCRDLKFVVQYVQDSENNADE